jgi:transcriptional regulatory protein LEU3
MDFALPSLYSISNPIPAIEAVLLLCLWPLPINTMYKDPSHALAGAAMQLAVQNGLHIFGHEQDFIRTRVCSPDSGKVFRAQLWMHCVTVFQRSDTPRTNPEDILKVAIAQAYAMVFLSGQS